MRSKQGLVSCIIPAYNEEKTIAGVIDVCLKTPEIGEIIVIDDGSEDQTVQKVKAKNQKITVIRLNKNKGKGCAVAQGVRAAQYPILLFLDADLINIKPHHLSSLIQPVINDQADMTIADLKASFTRPYSLI